MSLRAGVFLWVAASLAFPAAVLADPGHAPDRPHLDAVERGGSGGSGLVIGVTLATLVLLAVCGAVLKHAQGR